MSFNLLGGGLDQAGLVTAMNNNILELKNREKTEIFKDDTGTPRVILDNNGLRTTPAGIDVTTATNAQYSFNSAQNTLKVLATQSLTIPSLTVLNNASGSNGATIDLSAYPTNSIILPVAIKSGQPSFIWQGVQVLSGAIGFAGIVTATYSASYTGGGVYQLTRGIANSASGSTYIDPGYSVTVYVLQETVA
jgi:hypothetical protein